MNMNFFLIGASADLLAQTAPAPTPEAPAPAPAPAPSPAPSPAPEAPAPTQNNTGTQQPGAPTTPPPPGPKGFNIRDFLPIILIFIVIYFFMMRGPRKQRQKQQQMLSAIKKGDKVQTIGGILGTVVDIRDQEVVVKIDEATNTKIRVLRSAIGRVISEGEEEKK